MPLLIEQNRRAHYTSNKAKNRIKFKIAIKPSPNKQTNKNHQKTQNNQINKQKQAKNAPKIKKKQQIQQANRKSKPKRNE